eukprot:CAMPEP_0174260256 /NCGR_PEP_ID=MMETSP0439-20130205/9417_1 /TAXON_ID=0 /ORGANISM="Stereomyxa ramosa, Strain Chinc5" /LENGTH=339 /DNA_ID=CAMNT_0015344465 /DNA_START=8 /DNA_END=1027 /DNA_ORIENTATION=+
MRLTMRRAAAMGVRPGFTPVSTLGGTAVFTNSRINTNPVGARNGANLKELRTRIASIKNIAKITGSMKMIATAKLSKSQQLLAKVRPYTESSQRFFRLEYPEPALVNEEEAPLSEEEIKDIKSAKLPHLIVCLNSDRGLCGGVNSSVTKLAKKYIKIAPENTRIVTFGDKVKTGLQREYGDNLLLCASELSGNKPISYHEVASVVDQMRDFEFSKVTVLYNYFESVLKFITRRRTLPGLEQFTDSSNFVPYELEADRNEVLKDMFAFNLSNLIYTSLIEGQTSELGARMSSMDNATSNANDVMNKLTISYNRQRQAAITTELTEIVSGAAAIEEMQRDE